MPLHTELQPDALPTEQIGWFRVLGSIEAPAEDLRKLLVWHPFHHTRCTLTLFPGLDALQHRKLVRDVRRLRTINHPALMPVLDVVDAGGRVGILVEGTGGYSLRDCLNEVGALEVEEAVTIFRQILSGISALHHDNLTHGDLRPENIQLDVSGEKLIARIRGLGRGPIERWDLHSHYLSPELASGGNADPRSDVFSLGCIFYECLTGKPPFVEVDPWSRRQEIRDNAQEPLQRLISRLPMEVSFAIDSALKFHSEERFANARAFSRALPSEGRGQTEEVYRNDTSEEVITGQANRQVIDPDRPPRRGFDVTLTADEIADPEEAGAKEKRLPPHTATGDGQRTVVGGDVSRAENHAAPEVPLEKPNMLDPDQGLGDRMASAPVDAVIMGSRLFKVLGAPALATLFLMILWNWNNAQSTFDLREDVAEARSELSPILQRSLALADDVIAVGVEPNKVKPLVARFESADNHAEQVQAGHTLVTSMFRHVRSLKASSDESLNKRRRSLEVQLNALDREFSEYKSKNASLEKVTSGSLLGQLMDMLR